jgi:hypothetical protein
MSRLETSSKVARCWSVSRVCCSSPNLSRLPKGFVRIRHYGLLANRSRRQKIARCRALLSAPKPRELVKEAVAEKFLRLTGIDIHRCPACHEGRMVVVAELDPVRRLSRHSTRVAILDSS